MGLTQEIVAGLETVLGNVPQKLHEPRFKGSEKKYVLECIETTFVSSVGKFVDEFEIRLAEYTGAEYAIAVVNGTEALHIALLLAGVNRGDEVLIPSLSFVATANAVAYCQAIPHFVDSEEATLGLDTGTLRDYLAVNTSMQQGNCVNTATGRIIRAIVPMHTFGHPSDMNGLLSIAKDFNLALVEDAAESLGSFYHGKHTGTFGKLGTLSFNGNKIVTTGGGGAILTNDPVLAKKAKHITTTAKLPHRWAFVHDEIGYNYRMPNINAALGCAQLEQLPDFLASKRRLFDKYAAAFAGMGTVTIQQEPPGCSSNYWLQTLLLNTNEAGMQEAILDATNAAGYMTRPSWNLLHTLAPYTSNPRMPLETATRLSQRIINLPSSVGLA
jgi:perosamine synthetase